jgi:DNA-directed RNA polymerase specialized sigma24 family protein
MSEGRVVRYEVIEFDPLARMADEPDAAAPGTMSSAGPANERRPIQHDAESSDLQRCKEAELVAEAAAVARRDGKFHGPAWNQISQTLMTYAWKTLRSKIRTGDIVALVHKYDSRLRITSEDSEVLRLSPDARSELAVDTILRAIPDFQRNALLKGRWSADGGASLKTYFLNLCALHFRRAYGFWAEERVEKLGRLATGHALVLHQIGQQVTAAVHDIAHDDPRLETALTLLSLQDRTTRLIYGMKMREMTDAQIGADLGLSAAAVRSRVYRFNRLMKSRTNETKTAS